MAGGAIKPGPVSAALLLTLLAALGGAGLSALGGASDPTTTTSDLIVRGDAGTLTRLGVSGSPDGGVLTAAGGVVTWGPAPSAALPAAGAAGELLVADGVGTAYSPAAPGTVVEPVLAEAIGGTAGAAIVGDGVGGITPTSAGVSSLLAAASATAVRQSLDATRSISPLDTSGDWTTTAVGVGTGTLTGGVFTAASANGSGGAGNTGGNTTRSFPVATSRWELVTRIGKTGSSNAEWIGIVLVATGGTSTYLLARANGNIHYDTGSGLSGGTAFPVDGTGWLSVRYDGGRCIFRYGTGTTSAPPTSWTLLLDSVVLTGRALPPSALTLTGRTNAGLVLGADSTWYMDHLTVRDLSLGGL